MPSSDKMKVVFPSDDPSERIVGVVNFKDTIIVATESRVYRMVEGKFEPVEFVRAPDE